MRTVDVHIAQVRKKLDDAVHDHDGARRRVPDGQHRPHTSLVTKTRRTLRSRLVLAMAGIAIGVVVITGLTTIGLARRSAADTAEDQLEDKAPRVARQLEDARPAAAPAPGNGERAPPISRLLVSTLRISDAGLVTVTPDGEVTDGLVGLSNAVFSKPRNAALLQLPPGLAVGDLDTTGCCRGLEQTGRGDGIVFVAWPLTPGARARRSSCSPRTSTTTPTRQARGFFLLAALVSPWLSPSSSRSSSRGG